MPIWLLKLFHKCIVYRRLCTGYHSIDCIIVNMYRKMTMYSSYYLLDFKIKLLCYCSIVFEFKLWNWEKLLFLRYIRTLMFLVQCIKILVFLVYLSFTSEYFYTSLLLYNIPVQSWCLCAQCQYYRDFISSPPCNLAHIGSHYYFQVDSKRFNFLYLVFSDVIVSTA